MMTVKVLFLLLLVVVLVPGIQLWAMGFLARRPLRFRKVLRAYSKEGELQRVSGVFSFHD